MKHLLCTVPIFAGLDDGALDIFLKHATTLNFEKDGIIEREGESGHCMHLIESGEVAIIKGLETPQAVTLATLEAGEFFGEMCILETLPRSATGLATKPTTVVSISSGAFYHLYERLPAQHSILILNIARDLSRRLRRLDEEFAARH